MRFIDKLERKYGRYGIENLTMYIIISYVLGYALMYINPGALSMLSLNVTKILQGQVWRLITWIVYPPSTSSPLWFVIAILFFYYPISASLEHTWGKFKFYPPAGAPKLEGEYACLVITADKGLAGAYNQNVIKQPREQIAAARAVCEYSLRLNEAVDIEQRLRALEERKK